MAMSIATLKSDVRATVEAKMQDVFDGSEVEDRERMSQLFAKTAEVIVQHILDNAQTSPGGESIV